MTVDPGRVDELRSKFGGSILKSRRVELAALDDEHEAMFERGWTDGLPVVPPTELRVTTMLAGTTRNSDELVALVPPNLSECTVEKVAINSVMAGCRPEYLPVVMTAVEAVCTEGFNMHGVLATTMSVGPILVVNGPVASRIGMNTGINVLGHGNRANSSIGRAVQMVIRNVGGGKPGGIDRATLGHMGKQGFCFAENEAKSLWVSLSQERGFSAEVSTVTAFCGEGPRLVVDQLSRSLESLTRTLGKAVLDAMSSRRGMSMDAMLVISPEHISRYQDAGWNRERFKEVIMAHIRLEADGIEIGKSGMEKRPSLPSDGIRQTRFELGELLVVHAGGPAGLFSAVISGWVNGPSGSEPVTREITP